MRIEDMDYAARLALSPMPRIRNHRASRAQERFEKADRELAELGCACIGWDERALRHRDALQRKLFGKVAA